MTPVQEILKTAKQHITEGNMEAAIELLLSTLPEGILLYTDVRHHSGRLNHLKREEGLGKISADEAAKARNQVRDALLQSITQIEHGDPNVFSKKAIKLTADPFLPEAYI